MEIKILNQGIEDNLAVHAAINRKLQDKEAPAFCTYMCKIINGRIATLVDSDGNELDVKFLRKVYGVTLSYMEYEIKWFPTLNSALDYQETYPNEAITVGSAIVEGWE